MAARSADVMARTAVAVVEVICGACMLALGRYAWWGGVVAVAGSFASIVCLNPISLLLEVMADSLSALSLIGTLTRR